MYSFIKNFIKVILFTLETERIQKAPFLSTVSIQNKIYKFIYRMSSIIYLICILFLFIKLLFFISELIYLYSYFLIIFLFFLCRFKCIIFLLFNVIKYLINVLEKINKKIYIYFYYKGYFFLAFFLKNTLDLFLIAYLFFFCEIIFFLSVFFLISRKTPPFILNRRRFLKSHKYLKKIKKVTKGFVYFRIFKYFYFYLYTYKYIYFYCLLYFLTRKNCGYFWRSLPIKTIRGRRYFWFVGFIILFWWLDRYIKDQYIRYYKKKINIYHSTVKLFLL